jgi:signal transduction histidine kinase
LIVNLTMSDTVDRDILLREPGKVEEMISSALQRAFALRYQNPPQALEILEKTCQQLEKYPTATEDELKKIGDCQHGLGKLYWQTGQFDRAIALLQQAQSIYEKIDHKKQLAWIYALLGQVYLHLSSFVNALQYTLSGLELAQEIGDRAVEGQLLINLGSVYIQRDEFTRALPYILRATKDAEISQDLQIQAEALEKSCLVYSGLGNAGMALSAGIKSLNLFVDMGEKWGEARALNSLGRAYHIIKDYPKALECFEDALKISRQISSPYESVVSLIRIGQVYAEQELPGQALEPLHEALQVSENIQSRGQQVQCHQLLSSVYRQAVQFQRALAHYERFHEIKEQVFNDESETKLKNLEVVYQVEEARREAEREQLKNIALEQEIQERIQAQRALQSANEQLQKEIAIREQLIGDLNAFARMVAHDLKAPLQNQAILTHILDIKLRAINTPEEILQLNDQLQRIVQKQAEIIQELLTLASLRSQEVVLVPLDMGKVIQEVLNRLNFVIEDHAAQISIPNYWPVALGYAPWVEEVWANYLTNAIKYGGSPPIVQLGAFVEGDGFVRFWIQDNGDGISPEDQAKLFQDFSRVNHGRVEGHGLGLSIVARIIEKLGGKVGVDSRGRPGEGSRFWFTLRAAE